MKNKLFIDIFLQFLEEKEIKDAISAIVVQAILKANEIVSKNDGESKLLSTVEACKLLSISCVTLGNWSKKGLLNKLKIHGSAKVYLKLKEINQILKDPSFKNGQNYYGHNLEPP